VREPATSGSLFFASFYTAAGGACFFIGAYLMIPELFDEEEEPGASAPA